MALVLADRVQETTTTAGTGALTLDGAVGGFQSFAVVGNGNICYYTIVDGTSWEVGIGTYSTTGPTLSRTTVLSNSSGTTSPLTLSSAVKPVFLTYPAEKSVNLDSSGNVSALGTVSSGTWQGSTVGVAYGGTGVTSSSGANSVVLRDANQNVSINRLNQSTQTITASGGTTVLTAASAFNQALVGTGGQTFQLPDATTLTDTTTFQFNNNATGTLTITDYANATVGTISPGGAAGIALLANATVGGTWDVHAYIPENVTWGTNSLALGATVITGGTWNGGTITPAYGGTGLTSYTSGGAIYATGTSTLTSGTLPVASGGTGATTASGAQSNLNVPSTTGSGASGTWGINVTGNSATATILQAVNATATGTSTWNPGGLTYQAWGQYFTNNNISTDSGDITLWLRPSQYSGGGTELNMYIDGDYYSGTGAYKVLNAGNYNSYALPITGGTLTGSLTINGSLTIGSSGTYTAGSIYSDGNWGMLFRAKQSSPNTAQYRWATADDTELARIENDGSFKVVASIKAPIYYDSNNTAYYLDPTSTSVLSAINLPAGSQSINTTTPGTSTYQLNFTGQGTADYAQAITWGWSSSGAQAGIYVQSSGSYGTKMYLATTDSFATGAKTAVTIDHLGVITTTRNYLQATGSLRAPIFYDSDNTAYYLDPNSNGISLSSDGIVSSGYGTNGGFQNRIFTSGRNRIWSFGNADAYGISYFQGGPDYIGFHFGTATSGASQFWVSDSGISQTSASSRAPIFYDSDNTAYYVDPTSSTSANFYGSVNAATYNLAGLRVNASGTSSSGAAFAIQQVTAEGWTGVFVDYEPYTGWGLYHDNPNNIFLITAEDSTNNLGSNTVPSRSSGNRTAYSKFAFYQGSADGYAGGSWRAPIFYDSQDTNYYVDPTYYSVLYYASVNVGQEAPGAANSSSLGLVMRGNYNSNTWAHKFHKYDNGTGVPLYVSTTYGGGSWTALQGWGGGLPYTSQVYGSFNATDSLYSPIFYDSDNTGYYVNPNGTSNIYALTVNQQISGSVSGYSNYVAWQGRIPAETGRSAYYPGVYTFSTFTTSSGGNPPTTYAEVLAWGGGGSGAIQIAGDWISTTNTPLFVRSLRDCCQDWSSWTAIATSGVSFTNNVDLRAPIFYDSNNTGYYCDPSGSSYLYSLILSGASYFRPNNWIQLDGDYGIYSAVYNSAHFLANVASSYGQWRMIGSRNSYGGIYDTHSGVNGIMYDGAGNGGVYREANGRWYWYYNLSTDCMGVGTSGTDSTYSLYLTKGVYAQARIDAPIFYDTNNTAYYLDLNGTSNASTTCTGYWYFRSNQNTSGSNPPLQAYSNDSGGAIMSFHRGGYYAVNMGLDSDNVFRIGGWSASTNLLQMDMSGNLTMAGNVTAYSDERMKKDWADLPSDFVERLARVKSGTYTRIDGDMRQVGVGAQSLQPLMEEAVYENADGTLSVAYGNAALASSVELAKYVTALEQRISQLEAMMRHE